MITIADCKPKRRRLNASHRWTERESQCLVEEVVSKIREDSQSFEKPTAKRFYDGIRAKNEVLANLDWTMMKSKMRYLKMVFQHAIASKKEIDTDPLAEDKEKSAYESIKRVHPYFSMLEEIFGQKVYVNSNVQISTTVTDNLNSEETPDLYDIELFDIPGTIVATHGSAPALADDHDCDTDEPTKSTTPTTEQMARSPTPERLSETQSESEMNKSRRPQSEPDDLVQILLSMQRERLDREEKMLERRLKAEERKWQEQRELEKEKLELRKRELDSEERIALAKLQIELDEKRMRMEMEERVKKYDLELRYKSK